MKITPRQRLEAAAAVAITVLLRLLPRRAALRLGEGLGRLLGRIDRRHVAIAVLNLRHAFPEWDDALRHRVAYGVYAHFGRVLFDILWLASRPPRAMLSVVDFEGIEHYHMAAQAGRGILFITAHLGNWEVHAVSHGLLHAPLGVVARPLDNPLLDVRLRAFRCSSGNSVIYKRNALGQILRTLRNGGEVAILVDQNVHENDGIFVEFFGRLAATTTVAAALAMKTGCFVVPVRAIMREDGRYLLVYEAPLRWDSTGVRHADVARITQDLTWRIERWVRETPEQWLWIHRRWKTRPPDEKPSGLTAS